MFNEIGVIGLGTMGKSIALNFVSRGIKVAGFNRSYQVTREVAKISNGMLTDYENLDDFVASLKKPSKIFLMLPAGKVVDEHIEKLLPLLGENDILMDGGNSFFKDTNRRCEQLKGKKIHYFGVGVSGGEKGALLGPSIMVGGDKEAYVETRPLLEAISAKKNDEACCGYFGEGGAGHYVKMVHNGIEYADMQLIAEIYLYLKNVLNMSNNEMSKVFKAWNETDAKSYLLEITSKILKEKDENTQHDLIDMIKDEAAQKGTGRWTVEDAAQKGQNISLIQSALNSRIISNAREERTVFKINVDSHDCICDCAERISDDSLLSIKKAYMLGKYIAYAQGFSQIENASQTYGWDISLKEVAATFRAGCIIQAELLEVFMKIYEKKKDLKNFLLDDEISERVKSDNKDLRGFCLKALEKRVPVPTMISAMTYIDQISSPIVGANLIQAQRDFFGAHKFERIDKEGLIHHEWKD